MLYSVAKITLVTRELVNFYDTRDVLLASVTEVKEVRRIKNRLSLLLTNETTFDFYVFLITEVTGSAGTTTFTAINEQIYDLDEYETRIDDIYKLLTEDVLVGCCCNGGGGAGVQSVTGYSVDDTDPQNPIVKAIPVAGTNVAAPVTGDIQFQSSGIIQPFKLSTAAQNMATRAVTFAQFFSNQNYNLAGTVGSYVLYYPTQLFNGVADTNGLIEMVNELSNNWIKVHSDRPVFKGFVYGADYSANFDLLSLINLWVLKKIIWAGTSAPTVTDDLNAGFVVGSLYWDSTSSIFYKCTDATVGAAVWATAGGSTSPAGSNTQIQYNNSGSFGAEAAFTYDPSTNKMTVDNILLNASTASRILSTDGSKNITALDTATYPSLTELSYVKGATATNIRNYMSIGGTMSNDTASTGTRYYSPYGGLDASAENQRECILLVSGTVKTWYLNTSGAQPVGGASTWTVRQNTAATALTFVVAAGSAAGTFSDLTHSFSGTAGDRLSLEVVSAGGVVSAAINSSGFVIEVS